MLGGELVSIGLCGIRKPPTICAIFELLLAADPIVALQPG